MGKYDYYFLLIELAICKYLLPHTHLLPENKMYNFLTLAYLAAYYAFNNSERLYCVIIGIIDTITITITNMI